MLKTLIKNLKEVKNTLREKADLLPKVAQNLFGKRFRSLVALEVSSSGIVALLFLQSRTFGQDLHRKATNRIVEGDFTTVKNIETDIKCDMVGNKTTNGAIVSQVSKVVDQKLAPFSIKFPEFIPEESLTNFHPLVKYFFSGKMPNLQLVRRLAHFSKNW